MSEHLQYRRSKFASDNLSLQYFKQEYSKLQSRNILELGTKRWYSHPTHHREELSPWNTYTMTDVEVGQDVDVVADAHKLSSVFGEESFSVVWSSSVFEHLHSPWIAAEEILKVLKPGGLFFAQTHLCFPEHGYPNDFFRFTRNGLERLFDDATEVVSSYDFPATLTPHDSAIDWNKAAPNFLNVNIAGKK